MQNVISVNKIVSSVLPHFNMERCFLTKSQEKIQLSRSTKDALQHFTTTTYADNDRALGYDILPDLKNVPEPTVHFPQTVHHSLSCQLLAQNAKQLVIDLAQCKRNSVHSLEKSVRHYNTGFTLSAAKYGSPQTLLSILHGLLGSLRLIGKLYIPSCWRRTAIVLLHKAGESSDPSNFRPIALSNWDGKIFFPLVSAQLTSFMCKNNYFDGCLQKGFLPGLSGCVEHSMLSVEALRDARERHRSICFAWIDF